MSAVFDSKLEMLLASSFWPWGGQLPVVLLCVAALLAHLGDKYRNESL
jgi:hypothetical protein